MSEQEILARQAGLQLAWANHRQDVEDAIAVVARLRAGFARITDATAEPTPAHAAPPPVPRPGAGS